MGITQSFAVLIPPRDDGCCGYLLFAYLLIPNKSAIKVKYFIILDNKAYLTDFYQEIGAIVLIHERFASLNRRSFPAAKWKIFYQKRLCLETFASSIEFVGRAQKVELGDIWIFRLIDIWIFFRPKQISITYLDKIIEVRLTLM